MALTRAVLFWSCLLAAHLPFLLLVTLESAWAARIIKTKEPLEIKDVNIPKPKSDQVLVKVESAGVCHSDLHLWEGGYAGPQGVFMKVEDRGVSSLLHQAMKLPAQ
jgi:hypothetical protein